MILSQLLKIATQDEWRDARLQLLAREKELSKHAAEIAKERSELPLVPIDEDYKFTATDGTQVSLNQLFQGHRQLIVQHVMFNPSWDTACSSCSFVIDQMPRHVEHLNARNTHLVLVSRAPYEKLAAFQKRMGWDHVQWYSSNGSNFNYDFHVSMDENIKPVEYNYRSKTELDEMGQSYYGKGEQQGFTVFLKDGDQICHSYSCYARGSDRLYTTYNLLDMTPLGRQDVHPHKPVFKYHDEY